MNLRSCNYVFAALVLIIGLGTAHEASARDFCFGAAGQQCGEFREGQLQGIAFCSTLPIVNRGVCKVSGGSLTHDPCCASNPNGVVCGAKPESTRCQVEWDRSVHRAFWGYQWSRIVDTAKANTTGVVVRADYCARRNAGVHRLDRQHCCSGSSRQAGFFDRLGRPDLYRCN